MTAVQLAPIPRYPAIVRDVSFFCDDFQPAARIRQLIDDGRPALLEGVFVVCHGCLAGVGGGSTRAGSVREG